MKETYEHLGGERLLEQERTTEYTGAFSVLSTLFDKVDGQFKVLMNLKLPLESSSTEIDLLMLHETGIYVFEVNNLMGIIYGDVESQCWRQYFKTKSNASFYNPMKKNKYHLEALHQLGLNQPMISVVVFTNDGCDLQVTGQQPQSLILHLNDLSRCLHLEMNARKQVMTFDEMDRLFNVLKPYSTMEERENESNLSANDLLEQLRLQVMRQENEVKKVKSMYKWRVFFICLLALGLSSCVANTMTSKVQQKLSVALAEKECALKQLHEMSERFNFSSLNPNLDGNISVPITIEDVLLENQKPIDSSYELSFVLTNMSSYDVSFTEYSSLVLLLDDGEVYEYPIYNDQHVFNKNNARLFHSIPTSFGPFDLTKVNGNIKSIKLSHLQLSQTKSNQENIIDSHFEVSLWNN